jgi:hypothetical protein
MTSTTTTAGIGQIVTANISINIPQFSNLRTILTFSCLTTVSGVQKQFANILSFNVISMGKNVDGLMSEINKLGLNAKMSSISPNGLKYFENFYNDTATLDLGVVTNTGILLSFNNFYHNYKILNNIKNPNYIYYNNYNNIDNKINFK